MAILTFVLGLAFLIAGAEALVRGASRLAAAMGISSLVIGLTVVAFGTGAPELAVGIKAALSGKAGIAVGNVVGSNIFNILFILGLSALIVPLCASRRLVRLDVPLMIILSIFVLVLSLDGRFSRIEGLMMVLALVAYLWLTIYKSRKDTSEKADNFPGGNETPTQKHAANRWIKNTGMVLVGLAFLVVGSRWLVNGAVSFADYLGVSEHIVGLTIVAAGTSLPEVVTSIIAAARGQRDMAVGNVIGSNIFNILGVLGFTSVVATGGIEISDPVIRFDIPIMIAAALACLPIFFTGGEISRQEGALLFAYYLAYTLYLILAASHHDALPSFSAVMLWFVIPLTAVGMSMIALRELRRRKKHTRKSS